MIRVLQIVTYMGRGGLETMLMNYYRHIDREKVQFDFLVHREFEADYDAEIKELGGKIYHISRLVPWSKSYKNELKHFFEEHPEYKIVHVHQDCLSSVALKCAQECGIPVRIAHSHTSSQNKNWKFIVKKYYMKQIPQYASELFACGKEAGDWMFSGHEYRIICNAIDVSDYQYSQEEAIKIRRELQVENYKVIGHVGRFNEPKNHTFLVDIFAEYLNIDKNARLLLVGDGDGRAEIERKVQSLGIAEQVLFTGVRPDVNRLMQAMDIFVFPSLYEGLPVTLIEAQASGLRCVISERIPGECNVTEGLISTMNLEDTPQKWAEHIYKRIEYSREEHRQEFVKTGYDIASAAEKLQEYYLMKYRGKR